MPDLPSGTVTFLFTDVEGSTKLLHELGAERYAQALAEHRRVVRDACAAQGGVEVDTQGDSFFFAFPTAPGALEAARALTEDLASGPIRVRVGVHTGTPLVTEAGYAGSDVHRAARIAAAGHGGQVLVSASTAALVEPSDTTSSGASLVDLGEHRLKDLSAPQRLHQLGQREFPPLAALYQTNLPIPATPFLGRDRELDEVADLLSRADVRLLTLTGPGGTGKTRLAVQVAGALAERYPHGVWWVPLAPLRDPKIVLETAAHALGSKNGLVEHVADKRLLLVLDNFEHVIDAAAPLASVLAACPNLAVLVTSRERLHVSGEHEYPVPPLAHDEAVAFFAERARTVVPDVRVDAAVPEICRRLDDLPLALELAAARVGALSPRQILERLDQRLPLLTGGVRDAPERQRTLRATIEWSYELLSSAERQLFRRIAVFAGGCTLDAAEKVCDADIETLQSLVAKSLVRHTNERYWMLETIREYALELLVESPEHRETLDSHTEHFVDLVTEAETRLTGRDQEAWLDALEADYANVRTTLGHLRDHDEPLLLRCAAALWRFWRVRGYLVEGRMWLQGALSTTEALPELRAEALNGAVNLALLHGDLVEAAIHAESELELARSTGDALTVAKALTNVASIAVERLEIERAIALQREAADLARGLEDQRPVAVVLSNLGYMTLVQGDASGATALLEESATLHRRVDNLFGEMNALANLGAAHLSLGRVDEAKRTFEDALRIATRLRSPEFVAYALQGIAATIAESRPEEAAELLGASGRLLEETEAKLEAVEQQVREAAVTRVAARLGQAMPDSLATGAELDLDDAVKRALSLD
jgi:predicted ATPase/class 3 adenylate cyclase